MKKGLLVLFGALLLSFPLHADEFLKHKTAVIGEAAPQFELESLEGQTVRLKELQGETVLLHFWSAQCPYVVRYEERLRGMVDEYSEKGVRVLAINSNVTESTAKMKKTAAKRKLKYDVLVDPGYEIADLYGAITTPHVYIINSEGILVYEGAIDNQGWSEDNTPTEHYAREALESVLVGAPVMNPVTKSIGCTVKRN